MAIQRYARGALRALSLSFLAGLMACEPPGGELLRSPLQRLSAAEVPQADIAVAAGDNAAFGFDLYRAVREDAGNLVFSPYSVSSALAMTYAGARADTATEMSGALRFTLPPDRLHPAFNAVDLALRSREVASGGGQIQLRVANGLWTQKGLQLESPFLDTLALYYGTGVRALDFQQSPEQARVTINDWTSFHTQGRIPELLGKGAIDGNTRLVLTNAVYFKAAWRQPFKPSQTTTAQFHNLDGSTSSTSMMQGELTVPYAQGEGYQALRLPYTNPDLVLTIVLPDAGRFTEMEGLLDTAAIDQLLAGQADTRVALSLPRFKLAGELPLTSALFDLGMKAAFDPTRADFSGMDGMKDLSITGALHKAFIEVTEEGTEAAAATGVIVGVTSVPPPALEVRVDRPFLFLIQDLPTGTVLFLGRVVQL